MPKKDVGDWKKLSKELRKSIKAIKKHRPGTAEFVGQVELCKAKFVEWRTAMRNLVREA
ncbi:MAG: hypothetical protein ACXWJC_03680 [Croceibacterium sp.]